MTICLAGKHALDILLNNTDYCKVVWVKMQKFKCHGVLFRALGSQVLKGWLLPIKILPLLLQQHPGCGEAVDFTSLLCA